MKIDKKLICLLLIFVMTTVCVSCGDKEEDNTAVSDGILFSVTEKEWQPRISKIPDEYSDYLCDFIPYGSTTGQYFLVLTHQAGSKMYQDEYCILQHINDIDGFNQILWEKDTSVVIQRSIAIGNVLYSLIKDINSGNTILFRFSDDGIKELASYSNEEIVTIGGTHHLMIYRHVSDAMWIEFYDALNDKIEPGKEDLMSYSAFENPNEYRNHTALTYEINGDLYVAVRIASASKEINNGIALMKVNEGVKPARVLLSDKYVVFTDGYEDNSDIYIGQYYSESKDELLSLDLSFKKMILDKGTLKVFSMYMDNDKLYILGSEKDMYVADLRECTLVHYVLPREMYAMNCAANHGILYNQSTGEYTSFSFADLY